MADRFQEYRKSGGDEGGARFIHQPRTAPNLHKVEDVITSGGEHSAYYALLPAWEHRTQPLSLAKSEKEKMRG